MNVDEGEVEDDKEDEGRSWRNVKKKLDVGNALLDTNRPP